MQAVISGSAGRALVLDGDSLKSFDVDDPSELVPRTPADFAYLFGEMRDLRVVENTDIEFVRQELKHDSDSTLALDLALISLDAELPNEIRKEAVEGLDELLPDGRVAERLENILYARPLPEDADLGGALSLCAEGLSSRTLDLFQGLTRRQSSISEVSDAWDLIPSKIFGEGKTEFQHAAVREGLFRALVLNREGQAPINEFLMTALLNPSLHAMRNYRQVLQKWAEAFRQENRTPVIKPEMDELIATESLTKTRQRGRGRSIDRAAVLQNVESQKAMIVNAMRHDELGRIRKFVGELIKYQLKNGEPVHAAKSLCDLATEAKALGIYSLQLELAEQSTRVKTDDAWSWGQYADALLSAGQATEALKAYERADAFGGGSVAKNGRAETLKTLGRLTEALDAYDAVIADYPHDLFAKNGRAETLKALGQLNKALDAYDAIIADYPESVFSRTGRADTLKALGRLDDALDAYNAIIADYPENVVSKNGRAETLKALDRLNDALDAYDAVIADHPEDVVSRNGRADTLKALGRLNDALDAYNAVIADYPEDVFSRSGRAETLKALGQLNDALDAYNAVIADYPEDVVSRNGRADTLKALGWLNDALDAYDALIADYPKDVFSRSGRADTLKVLGRLDDALDAYNAVIADYPEDGVSKRGRSCVLAALHRYDEALADLPNDTPKTPGDWIGFHIRGMIFLRMRKVEEAIKIFRRGAADTPVPLSREYFRTALAVALMQQGEFRSAGNLLSNVEAQELQPQVNVLLMHCYGEEDQTAEASEAFESISAKPWSISNELIEELHRRYVLKQPPQRSDDWVFDQEVGSILIVADQQTPISNYLS